jgi:hypothetical protein
VGIYFQKRKDFYFHQKKNTKKGNFDGLHNQTVGTNFQKRKVPGIFTGKIFPKKEILMAYVSGPWENISKKGKSVDSSQKKYFQKRKF